MYKLSFQLDTERVQLQGLHDVQIQSSVHDMTDTAVLRLPGNVQLSGGSLQKTFQQGDAVHIQLGYDDVLHSVFKGYITKITHTIPLVLHLEDEMYALKKRAVLPMQFKEKPLALVLAYMGISKYKAENIPLGNFTIDASMNTVAKVLAKMKEKYNVPIFFRAGTLHVGNVYLGEKSHKLHIQSQLIDTQLNYHTPSSIPLQVELQWQLPNGKVLSHCVGKAGGEKRVITFTGLNPLDLANIAKKEYEKLTKSGFQGEITTFGTPCIAHGDTVELLDDLGEKTGKYSVEAVRRSFGTHGYRQTLSLVQL
jgi:hypothetical protein